MFWKSSCLRFYQMRDITTIALIVFLLNQTESGPHVIKFHWPLSSTLGSTQTTFQKTYMLRIFIAIYILCVTVSIDLALCKYKTWHSHYVLKVFTPEVLPNERYNIHGLDCVSFKPNRVWSACDKIPLTFVKHLRIHPNNFSEDIHA